MRRAGQAMRDIPGFAGIGEKVRTQETLRSLLREAALRDRDVYNTKYPAPYVNQRP